MLTLISQLPKDLPGPLRTLFNFNTFYDSQRMVMVTKIRRKVPFCDHKAFLTIRWFQFKPPVWVHLDLPKSPSG